MPWDGAGTHLFAPLRGRIAFLKDVFHTGADPRFRFRVGKDIKLVCCKGAEDTLCDVYRGYPGRLQPVLGGLPHGLLFGTQWLHG